VAPDDNSAALDGYDVYIADKNDNFLREATYCDGFTSPAVLAGAYCLVPMAELLGSSY
jgi:hypothetical protein